MHGSMRRGLETERPGHGHWGGATDRETGGHEGPRPYRQDRHRASPRPYVNGLFTAGVAHKKSAFELGGLGLSRVLSAPVREALSR
jgi:hypothetical protein